MSAACARFGPHTGDAVADENPAHRAAGHAYVVNVPVAASTTGQYALETNTLPPAHTTPGWSHTQHSAVPLTNVYVPGPHGLHAALPADANAPGGHAAQWSGNSDGWGAVPAPQTSTKHAVRLAFTVFGHGAHAGVPSATANALPAHAAHAVCPLAGCSYPAGHGAHAVELSATVNDPAAHGRHCLDAADGWCVPAAHPVHALAENPAAYVPGGQSVHAVLFADENRPGVHAVQNGLPSTGATDPSAHAAHVVAPTAKDVVRPGAHAVHAADPVAFAYDPAGHGVITPAVHADPAEHAVTLPPSSATRR